MLSAAVYMSAMLFRPVSTSSRVHLPAPPGTSAQVLGADTTDRRTSWLFCTHAQQSNERSGRHEGKDKVELKDTALRATAEGQPQAVHCMLQHNMQSQRKMPVRYASEQSWAVPLHTLLTSRLDLHCRCCKLGNKLSHLASAHTRTVVGRGVLLLGQQQARLGTSQRVIHLICVLRLEVHQALDIYAVCDEANQHGCQHSHVVQHPGLTQSFL